MITPADEDGAEIRIESVVVPFYAYTNDHKGANPKLMSLYNILPRVLLDVLCREVEIPCILVEKTFILNCRYQLKRTFQKVLT